MRVTLGDTGRFLRRHWLISILVLAGVGLRALAVIAYRPAILYVVSISIYLNHLPGSNLPGGQWPTPDPLGYDMLMLRPLLAVGDLFSVVLVQHLLGIGMAILIYAVLVRRGAWRWLAALAAAPVLLDAYQIYLEHMIMSDTLFEALITGGLAALAWNRRPGPVAIAIAGACLGASVTVRTVGVPLFAIALVYVLIVVPRWRFKGLGIILISLSFLVPYLGYQFYMSRVPVQSGGAITSASAIYARAATFVDCSTLDVPADLKQLCPTEPLTKRHSPDYYAHTLAAPIFHVKVPAGTTLTAMEFQFSKAAITQQPLRFARSVLIDAARLFTWNHDNLANPDAPAERWRFQANYPVYPTAVYISTVASEAAFYGDSPPQQTPLAGAFLREYQLSIGFTPGPLMALFLVLGLAGAVWRGRTRGAPQRAAAVLYLLGSIGVLGLADLYEFTWRYQLPSLVLLPLAGVLGFTALIWRPAPVPFPEPDDDLAIDAFRSEYGDDEGDLPALPPVAVVIAAYNEATGIGAVLDGMPESVAGRGIATIVVIDGGTDDTADIARKHGAYVCEMPRNRGQGAALRLGYYLARTGGAEFIVTTDADGQYDIGALPDLMRPLLDDRADFVTGSRRLGTDQSRDSIRRTGVKVFALIVSVLTGKRITDTSFGFRAMRAEITGTVTLNQPQYQSSELLIGVLSRGYRVVELPMTMRLRNQGRSKKGNNLVYGLRYARVVFSTASRERSARSGDANTNRSSSTYLATKVTAYEPK
jgi:hypothetical protein